MKFDELQRSIGAVIPRSGEVSIRKLDNNQQQRIKVATQSWNPNLEKLHAVKTCPRASSGEKGIMNMCWILKIKDTGQAKER